jgi:signal peptidase I
MKSTGKELLSFGWNVLIVLLLTWVILTFVGQRTSVSGQSMLPMLENGDQLIVDKLTYRFRDPERYDIIVFPYQFAENTYYIKRVIGLPGETVQIDDKGAIYINGELLPEHYGREVIAANNLGLAASLITLGKDEYFVLGDNRNNSSDSREPSVGNIRRKDIIGRAWMRMWPLKGFGILKHQ